MNPKTIKIAFFGDFFVDTKKEVPLFSKEIDLLLTQHSIACINMEGSVERLESRPSKKVGPHLQMNKNVPGFLESKGFSLVSLANNHAMDYGKEALETTIGMFRSAKICGAGNFDKAYSPIIIEKNGKKIGILAASEKQFGAINSNEDYGYAWINHPNFHNLVRRSKSQCDFLFIIAHCGLEDTNRPLPQWRERLRAIISHGADSIISTHTHTMQGMEIFEGKPIFYSLGNFFFGHNSKNNSWNEGYCVSFSIEENGSLSWERVGYEVSNTNIIQPKKFDFNLLDNLLSSKSYDNDIKIVCLNFWEKVYRPYYQRALVSLRDSHWYNIKLLIKKTLGKTGANYPLLLHNIMIESHRYATEIALKEITKIK